jgi:hypothetical protein
LLNFFLKIFIDKFSYSITVLRTGSGCVGGVSNQVLLKG